MPINKTKAIHDDTYLTNSSYYGMDEEKTSLEHNQEKVLTDDDIAKIEMQKQDTYEQIGQQEYLDNALLYAENEIKTTLHSGDVGEEKDLLITGIECNPNTAFTEFKMTQEKYRRIHGQERTTLGTNKAGIQVKKEPVIAYHLIMSFPKYMKIDPHEVNQIGQELIEEFLPDYQAIVCTHLNTQCLHNHIIICNYKMDGSRKIPMTKEFREQLRDISDQISLRHGFEIPLQLQGRTKNNTTMDWIEWQAVANGNYSWKEEIRNAIRLHASSAENFESFVTKMRSAGYGVDIRGEHITYATQDGTRKVRDTKLGTEFEKSALITKFNWSAGIQEQPLEENKKEEKKTEKNVYSMHRLSAARTRIPHKEKIYVSRYSDTGRKRSELERMLIFAIEIIKRNKDKWLKVNDDVNTADPIQYSFEKKIREIEKALDTVQKYGFENKTDIDKRKSEISMELNINKKREKEAKTAFEEIQNIQSLIVNAAQLQTIAISLGITDEELHLDSVSPEDVHGFRAEVFPATGLQRRDLFVKLKDHPEFRLKYKISEITYDEAQAVLKYFETNNSKDRPDILLTKEEYELFKAESINDISTISDEDIEGLEKLRVSSSVESDFQKNAKPTEAFFNRTKKICIEHGIPAELLVNLSHYDCSQLNRYFQNPYEDFLSGKSSPNELSSKIQTVLEGAGYAINRRNSYLSETEAQKIWQWIEKGMNEKYVPAIVKRKTDISQEFTSGETAKQIKELLYIRGIKTDIDPMELSKEEGFKLRKQLLHMGEIPDFLSNMKNCPIELKPCIPINEEPAVLNRHKTHDQRKLENSQAFMDVLSQMNLSEQETLLVGKYRDAANRLNELGISTKDIQMISEDIFQKKMTLEQITDETRDLKAQYKEVSQIMKQYGYHMDKAQEIWNKALSETDKAQEEYKIMEHVEHISGLTKNPAFVYGPEYDNSIAYAMTDDETVIRQEKEIKMEQRIQREQKEEQKKNPAPKI